MDRTFTKISCTRIACGRKSRKFPVVKISCSTVLISCSPPVQIARQAHVHRFLYVCAQSVLDQKWEKIIHISKSIVSNITKIESKIILKNQDARGLKTKHLFRAALLLLGRSHYILRLTIPPICWNLVRQEKKIDNSGFILFSPPTCHKCSLQSHTL